MPNSCIKKYIVKLLLLKNVTGRLELSESRRQSKLFKCSHPPLVDLEKPREYFPSKNPGIVEPTEGVNSLSAGGGGGGRGVNLLAVSEEDQIQNQKCPSKNQVVQQKSGPAEDPEPLGSGASKRQHQDHRHTLGQSGELSRHQYSQGSPAIEPSCALAQTEESRRPPMARTHTPPHLTSGDSV